MFAVNRTTIRSNYADESRIGKAKIAENYLNFQQEVEDWLEKHAPLPVTFDVGYCQPPFFSEYTYNDVAGGVWVRSLSAEFNSRYLQNVYGDSAVDIDNREVPFQEKYELLSRDDNEKSERTIVFLTGGNLFERIAWELVDRQIYDDDRTLIKAHPLTTDDDLKRLSKRYGWHRILAPTDSGYYWYSKADSILTTANSELFLRSVIDRKFTECLTKVSHIAKSSYFPFWRLLKLNLDHAKAFKTVILDSHSGFVFPTQIDWQERLQGFFEHSMQFRDRYQSHVPLFTGEF